MLCVSPDGFIVDIFPMNEAKTNDATILSRILDIEPKIQEHLQKEDVFLLDRGFRDVQAKLKAMGFTVHMPSFLDKNPQLSTEEANSSRMVTKCRWVVEAVNAKLKNIYKIFADRCTGRDLLSLPEDIRIIGCVLNMYKNTPLLADDDDVSIAQRMVIKVKDKYHALNTIVKRATFQKELKNFTTVKEDLQFPLLSLIEMEQYIAYGTYQLKQGKQYVAEVLKKNQGLFNCFECPENILRKHFHYIISDNNITKPMVITAKCGSRHRSTMEKFAYSTYVLVDNAKVGWEAIITYCCDCTNGLRTVGCCVHIMGTIYYLSYGRHADYTPSISVYLDGIKFGEGTYK